MASTGIERVWTTEADRDAAGIPPPGGDGDPYDGSDCCVSCDRTPKIVTPTSFPDLYPWPYYGGKLWGQYLGLQALSLH